MGRFPVSEAKNQKLSERMEALGIREADLIEEFIRGSGPGGQKINKTSATVLLRHPPSGLVVRCQRGRSQALNRYYARQALVLKLEARIFGKKSAEQQAREKIRRQKRRRSRRAKEKMLAEKKKISERKILRKKPLEED
jgi:protein subunit release factor B